MSSDYSMKIFWVHDAYVAIAPDLPGCSAIGDTPLEARQELLIVMELWLQTAREMGQMIPPPSTPGFRLEKKVPTGKWQPVLKPAGLAIDG